MILLAAKRLRPKFPMAIVVMGLGALATVLFDLPGHGVACLGAVEPGLPALHLPDWSAVSLTEGLGTSLPGGGGHHGGDAAGREQLRHAGRL